MTETEIMKIRNGVRDMSVCVPFRMRDGFKDVTYAIVQRQGASLVITPMKEPTVAPILPGYQATASHADSATGEGLHE
ncbi:MAG: hypothetical protein A4E23_00505 [Methanomethylovorans sp. PtaU1.Bin073]|nr:MAG: hypothetical protein A4E23_00505 [Methanomethylovorans sp. PtaU1.Bin073]